MIVILNENNVLELTEKAMLIKSFRDLYNYYTVKLKDEERAMAAFGVLYYMYYFDSQYLIDYPDEEERLKAVKKFVYKGDQINQTKIYKEAVETYKGLMDEDQTSFYTVMKANTFKIKEYAEDMVLTTGANTGESENNDTDIPVKGVKVSFTEFIKVNSTLPEQEELLRKFREKLQRNFKSEIDIYGGGDIGEYE